MIGFIFGLTLRRIMLRKSTLLLAGLATLPVILALVFLLDNNTANPEEWTARQIMSRLTMTLVVPLIALILGTSVFGDELEDGTAVYLLTKPIPRWQILLPQIAAAWALTAALSVLSTIVAIYIATEGSSMIPAFAIAVAVEGLAYCAVFVLLSLITNRALIAGLVYLFIWEGALTGIFEGLRYLAIRHYAMSIAELLADLPASVFNAYVGGGTAVIMVVIVTAGAVFESNRRLERIEVREPT